MTPAGWLTWARESHFDPHFFEWGHRELGVFFAAGGSTDRTPTVSQDTIPRRPRMTTSDAGGKE